MDCVAGGQFEPATFRKRTLLIFANTKESKEQGKRWAHFIESSFGNAIGTWKSDNGQAVVKVSVLDTTAIRWPIAVIKAGALREGKHDLLLDQTNNIRRRFAPISPETILLILIGPDFKLQAFVFGDVSDVKRQRLKTAITADLRARNN